jgi:hypothetical protein
VLEEETEEEGAEDEDLEPEVISARGEEDGDGSDEDES